MATVSLCMIVKNEALFLPRCLAAAAPLVEEIVVVDTGSTDDTPAVAKQLGARVFSFAFSGHFAAARNASLAQARGDWALVLDADELLEDDERAKLRQLIGQLDAAPADVGGYFLELVEYVTQGQAQRSIRKCQLFRRRADIHYEGAVHETPLRAIQQAGLQVLDSGVRLRHLDRERDLEELVKKDLLYFHLCGLQHEGQSGLPFGLGASDGGPTAADIEAAARRADEVVDAIRRRVEKREEEGSQ